MKFEISFYLVYDKRSCSVVPQHYDTKSLRHVAILVPRHMDTLTALLYYGA